MGKIFYIMGKSASGKDKIYKLLANEMPELKPLVIYTTRPMRAGETEGKQYHFIDEDFLKEKEAQGKVIEKRQYDTVLGIWTYCTVDDGTFDVSGPDLLAIGTLESYGKMRAYYGEDNIVPLYIEVSDLNRLERAIKREKKQEEPNYLELCRRFIADSEDFSEENLEKMNITKRFGNDGKIEDCIKEIKGYICKKKK